MAAQDVWHSCEICGLEGLSDEQFRAHMQAEHLEGNATCPFCQLSDVSPAEMTVHVNEAHLDYLTPDSDPGSGLAFIDDLSPRDMPSSVDQRNDGAALRSALALQLKRPSVSLKCPMCNFASSSNNAAELEEHVNRQHFDMTSPGSSQHQQWQQFAGVRGSNKIRAASNTIRGLYGCPLCNKTFGTGEDLELHVNIEHKDILSPASPSMCPVCGIELDQEDSAASNSHVEAHFAAGLEAEREQHDFEMLQAQYGMDNQGNFREQYVTNMQRAVYAGEMSVGDYYERSLELKASEVCGIDDGSSVTKNIVPRVRAMYGSLKNAAASDVHNYVLCSSIDHYASSYGDRGWGCGYRNIQMLMSAMLQHTGYNDRLYRMWSMGVKNGATNCNNNNNNSNGLNANRRAVPSRSAIPSISRLQQLIEHAWQLGFDEQGSEQLGCRLENTRKWIGATEVVTLLSSLRIQCQLLDFHMPTGPDGTHPQLFQWVRTYFENCGGDFVAPLYLQHQGHSRTIMGIEVTRNGHLVLLVLDPGHSPQQMAQFGDSNCVSNAFRLLRKNESSMKAKQYQIVRVVGVMTTEQQYQQGKVLRGVRIPASLSYTDVSHR